MRDTNAGAGIRRNDMAVQRSNEPEAFLAFERSAWNEVIAGYERFF
jgi:SAM-dependent methyltransferase